MEPSNSDATARRKQNPQHSPLHHLFFWAEISSNQPLSRVCMLVFEGSVPVPKSVIICICRFKGRKPLNIHVNNMAGQEIMVLAYTRHLLLVTALTRSTINMPEFCNPPTTTTPSSCSTLVSTDGWRRWWLDRGHGSSSGGSGGLNSHREQVFLLLLKNPDLSEEEEQFILAIERKKANHSCKKILYWTFRFMEHNVWGHATCDLTA